MSSISNDDPRTSHDFLGEFAFKDNTERAEFKRRGERVPVSPWVRQLVFRRDNWQCQVCGSSPFAQTQYRRSGPLHLDHIVPWSAGGSDRTDNLRTLCGPCNMRRSNFVSAKDRAAMPVIRACVPCLSGYRYSREDVPGAIDVFCGCCHRVSFSFPNVAVL